jgi:hypothetical protein
MKTPGFPKEIKRGSVSVTLYKTPSKGYPEGCWIMSMWLAF